MKYRKETESLNFLLLSNRVPFDWKTPFGYLLVWFAESVESSAVMTTGTAMFGFIYGSSWLFICMAKDITNDMAEFNDIVKTQENVDRAELMERFCKIIQLYSDAKQ